MSNCKNIPCGCADSALQTPPPCNTTGPCAGEPCSELFCDECILHCGQDMIVRLNNKEGTLLIIEQGLRMDMALQRLMLAISNPTCYPTAPLDFRIVSYTSTTITIEWFSKLAAENYSIDLGPDSVSGIPAIDGTIQYQITNLTPGTTYHVRIKNETSNCVSVFLTCTTLTA